MNGQDAFRLLFAGTGSTGETILPDDPVLRRLGMLLQPGERVHLLNDLTRYTDAEKLPGKIAGELFNALVSYGVLPDELRSGCLSDDAAFLLKNALILIENLRRIPENLPVNLQCQLLPSAGKLFRKLPDHRGDIRLLAGELLAADPFISHRVFSYHRGKFLPVNPSSAKDTGSFYGFPGVRLALQEHFKNFSTGKTSLPLLINSLPGYGKTSMVISFALAEPGTVVILPDPEALEESWQQLVDVLSRRCDRRFVLFFDDIDPRSINWYNFRTNVGGAFTPPGNIMPVLTANYEFPPSILSRGRRISYPVFDEERCLEMIEDFLGTFGMKKPPRNIVSLMGAEYTEEFGQKKFTELSPRTLMRHLEAYNKDPRKRKQIVELAGGGMITKPDAELFYEFNIELMRSLYGEEYIQRLLKERLRSL